MAGETEKLTIDLADQSDTFKKLLEENIRLQDALDKIQGGSAIRLVKLPPMAVSPFVSPNDEPLMSSPIVGRHYQHANTAGNTPNMSHTSMKSHNSMIH